MRAPLSAGISMREFCAYYLHVREGSSMHPFRASRLFQELTCDCWGTVEQDKLLWAEFNQDTIRADVYHGARVRSRVLSCCRLLSLFLLRALRCCPCAQDAVRRGDTDASRLGRSIILPSSHVGSPRHMQQQYQDAMAIVRKYGKPDIFLTFTCNPRWPEIQAALFPRQQAVERPDVVARVYKQKVRAEGGSCTPHTVHTAGTD